MAQHDCKSSWDEQIDEALERSKEFDSFPTIVDAVYRADPGWECLKICLSNGRRLLIPREMLGELKTASPQQASDMQIDPHGLHVWWPQLDDGLYLPDFLEHRWGRELESIAA